MIGKTNIGKTFGGCVRYVMEKEKAEVLEQSGVRIENAQMTTQDFNLIRRQNPKVENAVWHTSISFASQDQVNNELMREVANDQFYKNRTAQICDQLEKQFGLTVAREQYHQKEQTMDKIPLIHRTKIEIREAIKERLNRGIQSIEQLTKDLSKEGIETRLQVQSTGRINGISFRKNEIAIKGSAVDRNFSYLKLKRQLESNQQLNRGLGHAEI